MRQTYKIHMDGKVLILLDDELLSEWGSTPNQLALPYRGNKNSLFQFLDTLEKSNRFESIVLYSHDVKTLYSDLKSLLLWIPAAGGIIENDKKQILIIFRKGHWDLPKGKLDALETAKSAAIRECSEETGLTNLYLENKIDETWHLYRENDGQRALKKTKWFSMHYSGNEILQPQTEEGITELKWLTPAEALNLQPMYDNIRIVIQKYLQEFWEK